MELLDRDVIHVPFSYAHHAGRINELMRTYGDLPVSFADTCLVRMAELCDDGRAFAVDSDFRVCQKHGRDPIPVLMPDEQSSP